MKTSIMIRARCDSQRFPNKTVAKIYGKPMIQWIIEKSFMINNIDKVIVSTSDRPSDDKLEKIALNAGALIYRGASKDLFDREWNTYKTFDLYHVIIISGDSPFFDVGIAQILANEAQDDFFGYDILLLKKPYQPAYEITPTTVVKITYLEKIKPMLLARPDYEDIKEQYWLVDNDMPGLIKSKYIDCLEFFPPEHTPVKMSIDYPLELELAKRVVKYIGRFPLYYSEIINAYKRMKKL